MAHLLWQRCYLALQHLKALDLSRNGIGESGISRRRLATQYWVEKIEGVSSFGHYGPGNDTFHRCGQYSWHTQIFGDPHTLSDAQQAELDFYLEPRTSPKSILHTKAPSDRSWQVLLRAFACMYEHKCLISRLQICFTTLPD